MKKMGIGWLAKKVLHIVIIFGVLGVAHAGNTETVPGETLLLASPSPILAMDYDPESRTIYYVQHRAGGNALVQYQIATGKEQILHVQGMNSLSWVSLSRRGTVFVIDHGDNPFDLPWKTTTKPPQILEIKGNAIVAAIPLIVPSKLFQRSGAPQQTNESVSAGAEIIIGEATTKMPLGLERIDRLLRKMGKQEAIEQAQRRLGGLFVPRFLVLNQGSNHQVAVQAEHCEIELLGRFRDRLVTQNLSKINEVTLAETEKTGDALLVVRSRDFSFRNASKGFGFFNLPCEKYYDQILWQGEKLNLGSCAHGVLGWPQSLEIFTPEGDFLYFRWSSVHRLRPPKR